MTAALAERTRPVTKGLAESAETGSQPRPFVVMWGDGAANDLMRASLRVIHATGVPLKKLEHDLSGENRMSNPLTDPDGLSVVFHAGMDLEKYGYGLKAQTAKIPLKPSANRVLREVTNADVIVRTAEPYPGTPSMDENGMPLRKPITIVRLGYSERISNEVTLDGETYAIEERRMSRSKARKVARYAFDFANRYEGDVLGGPDFANDGYDAMLTKQLLFVESDYPGVEYKRMPVEEVVIFMGKDHKKRIVIPALERDGNILSFDAVDRLGIPPSSIPSMTLTLDDELNHRVVMTEALHDQPASFGSSELLNPMGMILAGAQLLGEMPEEQAKRGSGAIRTSVFETLAHDVRTVDMGGHATTIEFTNEVLRRVKEKMKTDG